MPKSKLPVILILQYNVCITQSVVPWITSPVIHHNQLKLEGVRLINLRQREANVDRVK